MSTYPIRCASLTAFACSILVAGTILSGVIAAKHFSGMDSNLNHFRSGGAFQTNPPVYSPDKQLMAYATTSAGKGDIVIHRLGENTVTRLSDDALSLSSPRFLGNSEDIIFIAELPGVSSRVALWDIHRNSRRFHSSKLSHDDLVDVDNSCQRILVRRTNQPLVKFGGQSSIIMLESLSNTSDFKKTGHFAAFSSYGIVFTPIDAVNEIWISNKDSRPARLLENARFEAVGNRGEVLFYSEPTTNYTLDRKIWAYEISSGRKWRCGTGHSPVYINDQQSLVLKGFHSTVQLNSSIDGSSRKIAIQSGSPTLYEDPATGAILLYVRTSSGTEGAVYEFISNSGSFQEVARIP